MEAYYSENIPVITEWLNDTMESYDELGRDLGEALGEQFLNDALDAANRLEQIANQITETAEKAANAMADTVSD